MFVLSQIICYLGGVLCLIYFIELILYIGMNNLFHFFWLILGTGLIILGLLMLILRRKEIAIPKWILITFWSICILIFLCFGIVESRIIRAGHQVPEKQANYLIVLGAKVNGTVPSLTLQYRIDAAAEYLLENEDTIAIVSGGKGPDEGISEAAAMAAGLRKRGIKENRIILEEKSTNTRENLRFSRQLIEDGKSVVITTSEFHMLRATKLAKEYFEGEISGLPAKSTTKLIITDYTREFFAVLKDSL